MCGATRKKTGVPGGNLGPLQTARPSIKASTVKSDPVRVNAAQLFAAEHAAEGTFWEIDKWPGFASAEGDIAVFAQVESATFALVPVTGDYVGNRFFSSKSINAGYRDASEIILRKVTKLEIRATVE